MYHKDKDPVNASICKMSHRVSFMGYMLFITGRGKPRSHASASNEDEGRVRRIYVTNQLPGRVAFSTWRRALALVHNRQIWFINYLFH